MNNEAITQITGRTMISVNISPFLFFLFNLQPFLFRPCPCSVLLAAREFSAGFIRLADACRGFNAIVINLLPPRERRPMKLGRWNAIS